MTRPCASRTLLSSCLRGQCRLTLGHPGRPGRADVAPPRPFRHRSYDLAAATAPPLACALDSAQRRRVAGRIQRSELLPSVTPCGLSNRARRTPVRGGGCSRRSQRWGRCIQATRDRWFPESGLCSHSRPWACGNPVSHRSAGVSMDAK